MALARVAFVAGLGSVVAAIAGCGGDSESTAEELRDGVYEYELSESYLVESGISVAQARDENGTHEVTIDSGRFIDRWRTSAGTYGSCWGTYSEQGARVTFRFSGGCVGDWAMTYSVEGDTVRWSRIEALDPGAGPDEQKVTEVFNGVPWRRTGDVQDEQ